MNPRSTCRPTALRGLFVAAAVSITLAGCSSSDGDTPEEAQPLGPVVTVPPDVATGPAADDEALGNRLLTTAELPVGFVPAPDPVDDLGLPPASEESDTDKSSTDPQQCAAVLAPIAEQAPGAAGSAAVMFTGPDFSSVDQDVAAYPDHEATSRAFATIQETLGRCSEYHGTDVDGVQVDYRAQGRDQRPAGDASVAFRLSTSSDGFTLTSDAVLVVVGNDIVQLVATGQDPIEPGVLADITDTAVRKLADSPDR